MSDVRIEEDATDHSGDDDEFYDASDEALEVFYPSKEALTEEDKTFLHSVFGALSPAKLLKCDLQFRKPPPPKKNYNSVQTLPFPGNKIVSPVTASQTSAETKIEARENTVSVQPADPKKRFLRIGGMLVLPVPAPGPLFSDEEV